MDDKRAQLDWVEEHHNALDLTGEITRVRNVMDMLHDDLLDDKKKAAGLS